MSVQRFSLAELSAEAARSSGLFDLNRYLEDIGVLESGPHSFIRDVERGRVTITNAPAEATAIVGGLYTIADGTQVNHTGHLYGSGDQILCTATNVSDVAVWLRHRWVTYSGQFE